MSSNGQDVPILEKLRNKIQHFSDSLRWKWKLSINAICLSEKYRCFSIISLMMTFLGSEVLLKEKISLVALLIRNI